MIFKNSAGRRVTVPFHAGKFLHPKIHHHRRRHLTRKTSTTTLNNTYLAFIIAICEPIELLFCRAVTPNWTGHSQAGNKLLQEPCSFCSFYLFFVAHQTICAQARNMNNIIKYLCRIILHRSFPDNLIITVISKSFRAHPHACEMKNIQGYLFSQFVRSFSWLNKRRVQFVLWVRWSGKRQKNVIKA